MAKLNISVTVPDDKVANVINALAVQNGWTEFSGDDDLIENPVTKSQWIKNWILSVVRASWKSYNDNLAVANAIEDQLENGSDFE